MSSQNFSPQIQYFQASYQVIDIIQQAYRIAGALKNPGQGLSVPSELTEGLFIANALIDGFKAENLMIIYTRRVLQTLNAGQESYSIGPGQDFDMERPEQIHRVSYILNNNGQSGPSGPAEIAMAKVLTFEQWQQFVIKSLQSSFPLAFYYQAAVPYGCMRFWPVPLSTTQVAIYTPVYLSEFQTVEDSAILPDGFREMLVYNIAVRVHERYPEKPMAESVYTQAVATKNRIRSNLLKGLFIGADPSVMQESYSNRWTGGLPQAWVPPYFR